MTALTRYCHNVPEQFRYPIVHLFHGFSNTPPIDDQTIRKSEKENLEKIIKKSDIKVCIIGGGITPLYTAVLLKQYQIIKSIHLVDTKDSMLDFVTDMYNIKTQPHINYFKKNNIKQALDRVDIVALMDETDITSSNNMKSRVQFKEAVDYVCHTTDQILRYCPNVLIAVLVQPVTATLAMISEIFKCAKRWNPNKIFGSVATYNARIEEITAEFLNLDHTSLSVPVAGGADPRTIVPLLSCATPFNQFTDMQHNKLLQLFRTIDTKAKEHNTFKGPPLSHGTAAAKLIIALARGLCGYDNITTCAYVRSNVLPFCRFFTSELELGPDGIKRNLGLPKISSTEIFLIEQIIPIINEFVNMAVTAARSERVQARIR